MAIQVRPAHETDVVELSRVLGRAFYDDPVAKWLMPHDRSRSARQAQMFAAMTRHHHLSRGGVEVAAAGPGIAAAALWDPPDRWRQPFRTQLSMLPALVQALGTRLWRGKQVADLMQRHHPEEPHWYLAVIGSDPSVRGHGFGQALMASGLDRCDAEHAPAYLESSKPENIPFYQRFGFTVTGQLVLPGGGPPLWPMWRQPR